MADTAIAITAGAGTNIDTRTEGTNNNHRQVVVIGDPATNAGVAPVDVADGLSVKSVGQMVIQSVTPSLLTSALDQDDILADTEVISGVFRADDKGGILESMTVLDGDDNGEDLIIYFLSENVVMGAEGSAVSITDANAVNILGSVTIAAADYTDLIASQIATKLNIGMMLMPASGTDDLYIAIVGGATNTSTYTASGLVLRLGIRLF